MDILKKILYFQIMVMIIVFSLSLIKIDQVKKETVIIDKIKKSFIPYKIIEEKPIGSLTISKIGLKQNIYSQDSKKNNIEENIAIINESTYPSKIVIAAHSGEGKIAYFNELDRLTTNDIIHLEYYDDKKEFIVKDIQLVEKTGYIRIPKTDNNILILTTCDKNSNHKQLVISCIEKEL